MPIRFPTSIQTSAAALAPLLLCAVMQIARAQDQVLEVVGGENRFREEYAGGAEVGGRLLVGLSHHSDESRLDLASIRVDYRGAADAETVCVRLTTGDGRYWALNPYFGSDRYETPPRIKIPTKFEDRLSRYEPEDFLALASLGDCASWADAAAVLVPTRIGEPSQPDDRLVAYVNLNRGDATASLVRKGGGGPETSETVKCERPEDRARVAYSRVCIVRVPEGWSAARVKLRISVRSLVGSGRVEDYTVAIW